MPRSGPISLTLPPFAGATRRLVLIYLASFFTFAIVGLVYPKGYLLLAPHLVLNPYGVLHGQLWQLVTYAVMPLGLLSTLFALLTLWFTGSLLEGSYGARWLYELFFTSAIGGALLACAFSVAPILRLDPLRAVAAGPFAGIFGLLIAIATYFGEQEFLLFFVLRLKAKYLVAIYILIELAILLTGADPFNALVQLCGALSAFLFLRFVPRRGISFAVTERYFSLRNDFYRAKRRRAARKFEVYMRKQNLDVHFDKDGHYVDPESQSKPNDKRWMN